MYHSRVICITELPPVSTYQQQSGGPEIFGNKKSTGNWADDRDRLKPIIFGTKRLAKTRSYKSEDVLLAGFGSSLNLPSLVSHHVENKNTRTEVRGEFHPNEYFGGRQPLTSNGIPRNGFQKKFHSSSSTEIEIRGSRWGHDIVYYLLCRRLPVHPGFTS